MGEVPIVLVARLRVLQAVLVPELQQRRAWLNAGWGRRAGLQLALEQLHRRREIGRLHVRVEPAPHGAILHPHHGRRALSLGTLLSLGLLLHGSGWTPSW